MVKKYISISFIVCLCLCTFTVASTRADDEVLEVGKPAPTIEIEKYLLIEKQGQCSACFEQT